MHLLSSEYVYYSTMMLIFNRRNTMNSESILTSIKKLLGIAEEYDVFDTDIIIHINTVFMTLQQLGVGPEEGYQITDASNSWDEFTGNVALYNSVKTYIFMKVKLAFDPPTSASLIDSYNNTIKELEWRINIVAELSKRTEEENSK